MTARALPLFLVVLASCATRYAPDPATPVAPNCSRSKLPAAVAFGIGTVGIAGTVALLSAMGPVNRECVGCGYVYAIALAPGAAGVGLFGVGARSLERADRCRDERRAMERQEFAAAHETIYGSVSGLSGTLILVEEDQEATITSDGSFHFPTERVVGTSYEVMIGQQPAGQACTVEGGQGIVASINVVRIVCTTSPSSPVRPERP